MKHKNKLPIKLNTNRYIRNRIALKPYIKHKIEGVAYVPMQNLKSKSINNNLLLFDAHVFKDVTNNKIFDKPMDIDHFHAHFLNKYIKYYQNKFVTFTGTVTSYKYHYTNMNKVEIRYAINTINLKPLNKLYFAKLKKMYNKKLTHAQNSLIDNMYYYINKVLSSKKFNETTEKQRHIIHSNFQNILLTDVKKQIAEEYPYPNRNQTVLSKYYLIDTKQIMIPDEIYKLFHVAIQNKKSTKRLISPKKYENLLNINQQQNKKIKNQAKKIKELSYTIYKNKKTNQSLLDKINKLKMAKYKQTWFYRFKKWIMHKFMNKHKKNMKPLNDPNVRRAFTNMTWSSNTNKGENKISTKKMNAAMHKNVNNLRKTSQTVVHEDASLEDLKKLQAKFNNK